MHSLFQIRPTLHKFIHLKYSYSAVLGELKTGLFNSQSKMMNKECASHILMMMSEMPLTTAFQQHQLCTKAKIKARLSHRGPSTLRTPPSYPLDKYCITTPPPPPQPQPLTGVIVQINTGLPTHCKDKSRILYLSHRAPIWQREVDLCVVSVTQCH